MKNEHKLRDHICNFPFYKTFVSQIKKNNFDDEGRSWKAVNFTGSLSPFK